MKNFSKSIGVLMVVLSLVLSLAACSSVESAKESNKSSGSSASTEIVVPEGEPKIVFTGYATAAYGPMEVTLDLYDEGTVIFSSTYAKRETMLDGSWSMSEDKGTISISIDEREETTNWEAVKGDDGFYSFEYKTFDGKGEAVIPFTTNPE